MIELLIEARERLAMELDEEAVSLVLDIDLYFMESDKPLIEVSQYLN